MASKKKDRVIRFSIDEDRWLKRRAKQLEVTVTSIVRGLVDKERERLSR